MRTRIALGAAGVLLIAFGAFRILSQPDVTKPAALALWLIGTTVLHDAVLVPITMLVGLVLTRTLPPRARRFAQGALVTAALVTAIAVPLIYRRGSQPASKSLELQNYGLHLAILIGIVAAVALLAYVARVVRDHAPSETKVRPAADHTSDER